MKYTFTVRLVTKLGMEIYVGELKYAGQRIFTTEAFSEGGCRKQIHTYHQKLTQKRIQESFLTA